MDIQVIKYAVPFLLQGLKVTIVISVISLILSVVMGGVIGGFMVSRYRILKAAAAVYLKIFRGTPFMIQVYLGYYALPSLGLDFSAFSTGVVVLSLYTGAYVAVILKAGLETVSKGQFEAAESLQIPYVTMMRRIILPQIVGVVIPPLTNQFIQTVKESSVLSIITISELTFQTNAVIGVTFSPFEVYLVSALMYWGLNIILEMVSRITEKRLLYY